MMSKASRYVFLATVALGLSFTSPLQASSLGDYFNNLFQAKSGQEPAKDTSTMPPKVDSGMKQDSGTGGGSGAVNPGFVFDPSRVSPDGFRYVHPTCSREPSCNAPYILSTVEGPDRYICVLSANVRSSARCEAGWSLEWINQGEYHCTNDCVSRCNASNILECANQCPQIPSPDQACPTPWEVDADSYYHPRPDLSPSNFGYSCQMPENYGQACGECGTVMEGYTTFRNNDGASVLCGRRPANP